MAVAFYGKSEQVGYVIDDDGFAATQIESRWYAGPPPAYVTAQELVEESAFQAAKISKFARAALAKWPDFQMPATLPDKNRFRLSPEQMNNVCEEAKRTIEADEAIPHQKETFP